MRLALALVIAISAAQALKADGPLVSNQWARVRPTEQRMAKLLATGMERSATFRALVRRLEASDVIVHIQSRRDLRGGVGASMRFVATSATDRFLRIQLNAALHDHMLVALLGHELQHAVEVADHAELRSADDLRAFYSRTGLRLGPDRFDSIAAREAGYLVRAELLAKPGGDVRMARRASAGELKLLDGSPIVEETHGGAH
jgi:hypothetical protein